MIKAFLVAIGLVIGLIVSPWVTGMHADYVKDHMNSDSHKGSQTHDHSHGGTEVTGEIVPTVTLASYADSKGGVNIQITTTDYLFTPESVGGEPQESAGHAHIYINDVKLGRVYGDWVYIPADKLSAGANVVRVTLNADDHSEWQFEGETIAAEVVVMQ